MKSNLMKRNCLVHKNKQVFFACYNKFCKEQRLVCENCLDFHSVHQQDLIDDDQIDEKVQSSSRQCKQLIRQLNDKFDELTQLFRKLIKSIESKFHVSIENISKMENQQFNQYLNQIILLDDKQQPYQNLTQTFNDVCLYFRDKISLCQNELGINELNQIEMTQMEKAEEHYKKGYDYYEKDDYTNAIKYFELALDLNKNHLKSLYYKGSSLKMLGYYKQSLEWFDKALQIEPRYADPLRGKGDSLRMLNLYKESIEWHDKALQIDPKNKDALQGKGDSLIMLGLNKESIEWFDKALLIDPKYKFALRGKGESLRMLSQYNQALEFLNSALQIDENYYDALGSMGACLMELNKLDEAEVCLTKALKLAPDDLWNISQLSILINDIQEKLEDKRRK